jgi:hypothetical protein
MPQDYNETADYFETRAKRVSGEPDRMARFLAVAAKYRAMAQAAEERKRDEKGSCPVPAKGR